jgi:hypothetical protein
MSLSGICPICGKPFKVEGAPEGGDPKPYCTCPISDEDFWACPKAYE